MTPQPIASRDGAPAAGRGRSALVFLLDVDNTLLDNDRVKVVLDERLSALVSEERAARFWELYEAVRRERGIVDFAETISRFARDVSGGEAATAVRELFETFPFGEYLFPGALEAVRRIRAAGVPVVLSDGDPIFQKYKIARAGISAAVGGNVLVFDHKEEHLAKVVARFPADHYVFVDDKADILAAVKRRLGAGVTTVHVRQGRYGLAPFRGGPSPDLTLGRVAELADFAVVGLLRRAS